MLRGVINKFRLSPNPRRPPIPRAHNGETRRGREEITEGEPGWVRRPDTGACLTGGGGYD